MGFHQVKKSHCTSKTLYGMRYYPQNGTRYLQLIHLISKYYIENTGLKITTNEQIALSTSGQMNRTDSSQKEKYK
jgi:hypothetical protein